MPAAEAAGYEHRDGVLRFRLGDHGLVGIMAAVDQLELDAMRLELNIPMVVDRNGQLLLKSLLGPPFAQKARACLGDNTTTPPPESGDGPMRFPRT